MKPMVAVFDVATSTGVAWGRVGAKAQVETWNLRNAGEGRPARLCLFSSLCDRFFLNHRPDVVRFEAPMPIAVASRVGATEQVMLLLRGAIGVLESRAYNAGVSDIGSFSVHDARKHLTGQRTFPKDAKGKNTAKAEVMKVARMLGVTVSDDNQADAFAGWSYTCGLLNPRYALAITPLFGKRPAA